MSVYHYKKGLLFLLACFSMWGFQPLYWYIGGDVDTFFLMACRIIWAAMACLVILKMQGKLPLLRAAFRDKAVLKRELPAALFLFGDWVVYLWAVKDGRVFECSLGYYIQPLVVFFFGAVIFREKVTWRHPVILAVVIGGIVLSTQGFGSVPLVTISLAVMFAIYSAIKKSLTVDSIVSTTMEILMMVPLAVAFILLFRRGEDGLATLTVTRQMFLIGGGIVTGIPMLFFAMAVKNLPLMTVGIGQYLAPTISIFCGMIMGEHMTQEKLVSFLLIWLGVILYCANLIREQKRT